MGQQFRATAREVIRILGSISLLKRCSSTGTDFLEKWSMSQSPQYLRGTWTMPLVTCFYLVSSEVVKQLDWTVVGNFKTSTHINSILFYDITVVVITKCVQTAFCKFSTSYSCPRLLEKSTFLFPYTLFIYSPRETPRNLYIFTDFQTYTSANETNFSNLISCHKLNVLC